MHETVSTTKKKILETALRLFKEKGYENVSIAEISKAAGVSPSTFYYQFTSKNVLFYQLVHQDRALPAEVLSEMLTIDSPLEKLWRIHLTYATLGEYLGPELYGLVFKMRTSQHQSYAADGDIQYFLTVTRDLIQAAQARGEIKNPSPAAVLADGVFHLIIGLCHFWCVENGSFDLGERIRAEIAAVYDVGA